MIFFLYNVSSFEQIIQQTKRTRNGTQIACEESQPKLRYTNNTVEQFDTSHLQKEKKSAERHKMSHTPRWIRHCLE